MAKDKSPALQIEAFTTHQVITQPNPLRKLVQYVEGKDVEDPIARAEKALADLSGEFEGWMSAECERLSAAYAAVVKDDFSAATRDELFRAAHDIKGGAATFGYPTAGAAAESLCRIIEHAPDLAQVPGDLVAHHIHAIQAIVREQRNINRIGVANELSRRLRSVADDYLTHANRDRPEHLEAILAPSIVPGE
jgi:chemotaxis protein histidine kinase CheA